MSETPDIPIPFYRLAFKGITLRVARRGEMREAIRWLKGRSPDYAIISNIDGEERTVLRGGQVG